MSHIPYGYVIENGVAVIDEEKGEVVRKLYQGYLRGLSLSVAAKEAGIETYHGTAGKMLRNKRYIGDDYYPPIIDKETFEKVEKERVRRAEKLGRVFEPKEIPKVNTPTRFMVGEVIQKYANPFKQAEYAYSLIESEVVESGN